MNNLNNATRPYVEVINIPPAEAREVKATWLGRIVQSMEAAKMYMTVTAFRGCFLSSTWPTQEESGRTPSRATAKMRREAATIMVEVHYTGGRWCHCRTARIRKGIYHDQTNHCDDSHEDAGTLTQCHSVDLYERLGSIKGKKGI